MKLFLDDVRNPSDCFSYMYKRIGPLNAIYLESDWLIVRNYEQFKQAIISHYDKITHISFDHDLADGHYHESMNDPIAYSKHLETIIEKTGTDCAKFVKEFYQGTPMIPIMFVHSMNPVGTQNIINVWKTN